MKQLLFFAAINLGLSLSIFAQIPDYVPADGLAGWWPFNGNANDESGNGNNGTVDGAVLTTDRFGNADRAYNFNGGSQKIIVPTNNSLNFEANNSFSVSYWIKPSAISNSHFNIILSKQTGSGNTHKGWNTHLEQWNKNFEFRVMNGSGTIACAPNAGASPNLNVFYHIVNTLENGIARVYVNGALMSSTICSAVIGDNNSNFHIGMPTWSYPNATGFNGVIDDIGIWNRALTEGEVIRLYEALTTDVSSPAASHSFIIFPNPASRRFYIEKTDKSGMEGFDVRIINALGQTVFSQAGAQKQVVCDMSTVKGSGIYFVYIFDTRGVLAEMQRVVLD